MKRQSAKPRRSNASLQDRNGDASTPIIVTGANMAAFAGQNQGGRHAHALEDNALQFGRDVAFGATIGEGFPALVQVLLDQNPCRRKLSLPLRSRSNRELAGLRLSGSSASAATAPGSQARLIRSKNSEL